MRVAAEALTFGLANRVVPTGEAVALARDVAALPQAYLRNDGGSALEQWG